MNTDILAGQWKQMRGHVKEWWGNLTDDDLAKVEGKRDRLVGLLQKQYGYTRDQAEQELEQHLRDYESYEGSPVTPGSTATADLPRSTTAPQGVRTAAFDHPTVMPVGTLMGYRVINPGEDDLGTIEDIVIDMDAGRIVYAVLSFGGFLGFGDKYFAIPWEALKRSPTEEAFILHVDRDTLSKAPGFDKDHWPVRADRQWGAGIYDHYGYRPYWED